MSYISTYRIFIRLMSVQNKKYVLLETFFQSKQPWLISEIELNRAAKSKESKTKRKDIHHVSCDSTQILLFRQFKPVFT